jgi:hypothetical protein
VNLNALNKVAVPNNSEELVPFNSEVYKGGLSQQKKSKK